MNLTLMLDMYFQMLRIRKVEERLIDLWKAEEIRSLIHLSTGQEAVAVGVCKALKKEDSVVSTHRCHAHFLAKGGDIKKMFAELAGKTGGCCRGKGGSMHLFDREVGMNLSLPLVGGSIPIAVGYGFSASYKNEKKVSVAFFGDGAVEEGIFWESLNFASVFKLPVIFVCENNLYAVHAHISKRQPTANIVERVAPFGIYAVSVDGNNVLDVFEEAKKMVDRARANMGPSFLEAKTYRWREHWGPGEDWHLGYRNREEGNLWEERCPIRLLRGQFLMMGGETPDFSKMEDDINREIEEAIRFAKNSPEPIRDELYQ
jgi:TPP-dependent pyruvate/acetoin dehydrogenase alpha subunit